MHITKRASLLIMALFIFVTGCSGKSQQSTVDATSQGSASSTAQEAQTALSVYTTIYPVYDFASKIGGEHIQLQNLIPPGTEAHDWEPSPTELTALEKADVFIYNGAGMEHWVEKVLASLSNTTLLTVEASKPVILLEGHGHSHDEDDDHDEEDHDEEEEHEDEADHDLDPHVWLSPKNAKLQMEAIKDAFCKADPAHAEAYEKNFATYSAELDKLDEEFHTELAGFSGRSIVVAHQAFGYLCSEYGLEQMAIEGLTPHSEPTPARMASIIDFAKENQIKVIFFEEMASPKVAETIAKATGATTDILNPLEGLSEEQIQNGEDYFSVMRKNLAAIVAALKE